MGIRLGARTSGGPSRADIQHAPLGTPRGLILGKTFRGSPPAMRRCPSLPRTATTLVVALLLFSLIYHSFVNKHPSTGLPSSSAIVSSTELPSSTAIVSSTELPSSNANVSSTELPSSSDSVSSTDSSRYVPCFGARGKLLSESEDDAIEQVEFDHDDALELDLGTYRYLPLKRTWATSKGRYGPYGLGESNHQSVYNRTVVQWHHIDWAQLQNNCTRRNLHRFGAKVEDLSSTRRMSYPTEDNARPIPHRPAKTTGRTAIVLRGWEEFVFHDLDNWSLRALITETALAYGGDYSVFLLVDVHDRKRRIFESSENYEAALDSLVPKEFRNMTVLFDASLLAAWYPKAPDNTLKWQDWQPMQLFAHFFDDFDHFWQFEMDARFTGHAGHVLESLSTFARNEPRKQAVERTSYSFVEEVYGDYHNLIKAVNASLDGGSRFWSGIKIPDLAFIGPEPPVDRAEDDDFKWGVGEDADCIILGRCHNLTKTSRKKHRKYVYGFELGKKTQRLICPPSSGRNSWNLLNGIHSAQREKGLAVPSEATPASFAMWLNLKMSRPPFPVFFHDKHNKTQIDILMNGGPPKSRWHGTAHSMGASGKKNKLKHGVEIDRIDPTWRPRAKQARRVADAWFHPKKNHEHQRPLFVQGGKVWMTNTLIHPVKTNINGGKNYHSWHDADEDQQL